MQDDVTPLKYVKEDVEAAIKTLRASTYDLERIFEDLVKTADDVQNGQTLRISRYSRALEEMVYALVDALFEDYDEDWAVHHFIGPIGDKFLRTDDYYLTDGPDDETREFVAGIVHKAMHADGDERA